MPESTLAAHQTRDPERVIDVRHPDFADLLRCLDRSITSHDDVITAHVLTVLSGVFPNGEEMFIDAVRHFRPAVTDPDLGRQV
ncbi:MAG: metal-dependent hydrolase, partial [Actinobacteria bacterium]|nr:metal-dependent hydrolase [Actinomycetota bacterium]